MAERQQIDQTVEAGARWLLGQQNADASFGKWGLGSTCLATLALIHADLPHSADIIGRAVDNVMRADLPDDTYFRALTVMMLVAADDNSPSARQRIYTDAQWLVSAQNGDPHRQSSYGGWGDARTARVTDGAHTHYAIMGLYSAVSGGIPVPAEVWNRATTWYRQNLLLNRMAAGDADRFSSASQRCMVSAAWVGLKIIRLVAADPGLTQIVDDLLINVMKWLGDNYMVALDAGFPDSWYYYYLYSLTRGSITHPECADMGGRDWYADMAENLIARQKPGGQWDCAGDAEASDILHTSFALLALRKANARRVKTLNTEGIDVTPPADECRGRSNSLASRRVLKAGFPVIKTLEEFDFSQAPEISPAVFRRLAQASFVSKKENIFLIGGSGTGKTHLATALGIAACHKGFRVKYYRAFQLVNQLAAAQLRQQAAKVVKHLSRPDLLIIDELSYFDLSRVQAELLFQVLSERYEKTSTIITTNVGLNEWTKIWRNPVIANAIVGRASRQSYIFHIVGPIGGYIPTNRDNRS